MSKSIPTREEVNDAMEDGNWAGAAFAIAAAYVEGRLVDRETIDYDVAIKFAEAIGLLDLLGDPEFGSDEATADQLRWVIEVAVTGKTEAKGGRWLAAAIGDTDE